MDISIVIPLFNRQEVLAETLESVQNQTLTTWECIIVDDGSSDESISIAEGFARMDDRFQVIKRERKPKGANTCRNIGLGKSNADKILFLDSDDILSCNFIESQLSFIKNNPCDAVISQIVEFDDVLSNNLKKKEINLPINLENYIKAHCSWITSSVVWEKASLININGFDEGVMKWQDWLLNIKALAKDQKFKLNSGTSLFYRISSSLNQISNSKERDRNHFDEFYKTRLLALNYCKNREEKCMLYKNFNALTLVKVQSNILKMNVLLKVSLKTKSLNLLKTYIKNIFFNNNFPNNIHS